MKTIVHLIPGVYLGGAEKVLELIASHQAKCGHNTLVIVFGKSGFEEHYNNLKIVQCSVEYQDSLFTKRGIKIDDYESKISEIQPDIIHSHSYWTDLISHRNLRTNILYISHFHLCYPNYDNLYFKKFSLRSIFRWIDKNRLVQKYKKTNCKLVVSSEYIAKFYHSRLPYRVRQKLKTLSNPVDEKYFEARPFRVEYDLVTVGRLEDVKNHQLLIFLVKKLKLVNEDIRVAIVGDGSKRRMLESLVVSLGISDNVIFLGAIKDVKSVFEVSRIYIHTSHAETFGLSIFEAMAAGIPVIVKKFEGLDSTVLIDNFNCKVISGDRHDEYLDAYLRLFPVSEFSDKLTRNAIETARKFSSKNYLTDMDSIYGGALGGK